MKSTVPNATRTNPNGKRVLELLAGLYPDAAIALTFKTPWELLVAVMLSAQCTDKKVNEVTPGLFHQFPTMNAFASADKRTLEKLIFPTGFYHMKAAHIQQTARIIAQTHNGAVPKTLAALTALPGVGRKTAHIVLANAYGIASGIPVDTHVARISQRLRLVDIRTIGGNAPIWITGKNHPVLDYYRHPDTNRIETQLCTRIPKSQWNKISYQIIEHGRALCKALRPGCSSCSLAPLCPAAR